MTIYTIFDGAYLMYNDMHMTSCDSDFQLKKDTSLFCIDHCREGRMETEVGCGAYQYLQEHEMRVDDRSNHAGRVSFPLNHYLGISIGFDIEKISPMLNRVFGGFSVNLYDLKRKFCDNKKAYVIYNESGVEKILMDLYKVPQKIKADYYRVKALELLLYLDALEISDSKEETPYFYKEQVEKVKAIQHLITTHLEQHYTLEELAKQYQISLTAMKNCFKGIYGDSMYSYLKRYRMNAAASLLIKHSETNISEVAGAIGYESPSKFSAAFRKVMGCSPMEYRKRVH